MNTITFDKRAYIARLESRMALMQRDLTIRLGVMMATSIAVVAALVRLL